MRTIAVVIGAGHSGLAMSARLTARSIDHVVLERGEIANSWRTERWESFRLLTPNWQFQLPAMGYDGDDPDGFTTASGVVSFIDAYAAAITAPVLTSTPVRRLAAAADGYEVVTTEGTWHCEAVVIASGAATLPHVPGCAAGVPTSIDMVTPVTYRSPDSLDRRPVLVVGASATGVQLAEEIHRSGRDVTISVGEHVRLPRTYRGRDIFWWMDTAGVLDERYDEVDDIVRARHVPSPQLIGTPEHRSIDLNTLSQLGVEIVGRLCAIRDGVAQFSGGLANSCRLAHLKMDRLLDGFDGWAATKRSDVVKAPHRFDRTSAPAAPALEIDLRRRGIGTVVWATGYRADHAWIDLSVRDHKGQLRHTGGVVHGAPGVYLLGGPLLRARRSSYLSGALQDTDDHAAHLHRHLDTRVHRSARVWQR